MAFPLKIAIYADGANKDAMIKRYREGLVKGFTTNPSLMAKAGIRNYKEFALSVLSEIKQMPISFEVFSDDFQEMKREALEIKSWAANVNVKIPITNTKGQSSMPLIKELLSQGTKLNVTALFTDKQIDELAAVTQTKDDVIVSIFAGRIADTGVDPEPIMRRAVEKFKDKAGSKILWASPREVLNAYQAEKCGCHIITMGDDQISKFALHGKSLETYSLETVKQFYVDAQGAGFKL